MSYLLNLNYISNNVTSGFMYVNAYTTAGTLTESTPVTNLRTRNVAESYIFTPSADGKLIIELGASVLEFIQSIGVLGSSISSFNVYKGFYLPVNQVTVNQVITRKRSKLGNPKSYTDDSSYDSISLIDSDSISGSWILEFDVEAGVEYSIGSLWNSDLIEVDITPSSVDFSPNDTTQSDYSNGGQKYVNTGAVVNNLKLNIPALTQAQAKGDSSSIEYINNTSGIAHPLIVIPYNNQNMMIYGTQKTLAKLTPVMKNDSITEWYYKASMVIEEEL